MTTEQRIEQLEMENAKLAAALRSMVFEFSHYVISGEDEHEAEALEEAYAALKMKKETPKEKLNLWGNQ